MGFRIENIDTVQHTWGGLIYEADTGADLTASEAAKTALDSVFVADLSAAKARVLADGVVLADAAEALDRLRGAPQRFPIDSDGASLARTKQTTLGWTFQDHSFVFKAATLDGIYSKSAAGSDFGFTSVKFYELVAGVETLITGANATDQSYLTANAVKTVVDWEPTWDFDVVAGELRFYNEITADVRLWVVVVPDVPANLGGSKELLTGGRNLRFVSPRDIVSIDGRVTKHMTYNGTYHTNKFRFTLRHPIGFASEIETTIQLYKA